MVRKYNDSSQRLMSIRSRADPPVAPCSALRLAEVLQIGLNVNALSAPTEMKRTSDEADMDNPTEEGDSSQKKAKVQSAASPAVKRIFKSIFREFEMWHVRRPQGESYLAGTNFDVELSKRQELREFVDATTKLKDVLPGILQRMPNLTEFDQKMLEAGIIQFNANRSQKSSTFFMKPHRIEELALKKPAYFDLAAQSYLWFLSRVPGATLVSDILGAVDVALRERTAEVKWYDALEKYRKEYKETKQYSEDIMREVGIDVSSLFDDVVVDIRYLDIDEFYGLKWFKLAMDMKRPRGVPLEPPEQVIKDSALKTVEELKKRMQEVNEARLKKVPPEPPLETPFELLWSESEDVVDTWWYPMMVAHRQRYDQLRRHPTYEYGNNGPKFFPLLKVEMM